MHYFTYKNNSLHCEGVKVSELAQKFATPLYVYSARTILEHFSKIKKAFSAIKPLICYSVKVNSNLSIMKLLVDKGAGFDIVSGGELYRAIRIKCPPKRIVYASVGKTDTEIKEAIKAGILLFTVESLPELRRIDSLACALKKKVAVALRFNPNVEPGTHAYITTGKKETKFGMDRETIKSILLNVSVYPHLDICGIHIHIGSQITKGAPYVEAIKKVKGILKEVGTRGPRLKYFDIGGGLGIVYDREKPQTADEFAQRVLPLLKGMGLKVILEPGRFIAGNAGILVAKVVYVKNTPQKRFVIVDGGMNDLIRPALYGAYHRIVPLKRRVSSGSRQLKLADVVGPICESSDFLGKERKIDVKEGDYVAVLGAGGYGFSMSSNYNSRPRAAEVLVKNNKVHLIRKRQTYKDLIAGEVIV